MSSFPDVLSDYLYQFSGQSSQKPNFTVPAEYAFAVVQVCLKVEIGTDTNGVVVNTSHGNFTQDLYNYNVTDGFLKDFPILNLIIKGGESFSLISTKSAQGGSFSYSCSAKVTALCHKKPS